MVILTERRSGAGGSGGGVWSKLAEEDFVQQTKCQVNITPSASALKLRVDISYHNLDGGTYHPMMTINDNATANVRSEITRKSDGLNAIFTAEQGIMLSRDVVAAAFLRGFATVELPSQEISNEGSTMYWAYGVIANSGSLITGGSPSTAAITSIELVDEDFNGQLLDAHIVVWELVE